MEDKDTPTLEGSKQSAALDKFFEAMAKAQGQFQPAELDGVGHYGKYSTISAVLAAVRKPLAENGIAIVQRPQVAPEGRTGVFVETLLGHSSGQFMSCTFAMPLKGTEPINFGSVMTYVRRYSLTAMLGIEQEDFEDKKPPGETPSEPQKLETKPTPAEKDGAAAAAENAALRQKVTQWFKGEEGVALQTHLIACGYKTPRQMHDKFLLCEDMENFKSVMRDEYKKLQAKPAGGQ